ncbi:TIGR04141 family sporadically distributed protein [Fictibacillus nanhaiensis]|uniref:DUF6119 family protein n=1 Tax=Fictibacillus nanhaiensis TaxID=742169 RepID=UPI002040C0DC|nr:DUF6119 family protein [Fictibacillus nanhaiensis]MCM3732726.1 TIGR04141 family sporadically distributed protein [Fictibacillus nanhaiensis]
MGRVNIYKIAEGKKQDFLNTISEKLVEKKTLVIKKDIPKVVTTQVSSEVLQTEFHLTLYISAPSEEKKVTWNWLLNEFQEEIKTSLPNPKAIVVIKHEDQLYGVTFGFSYFVVDKYCDRNFAFNFARKLDYKEVKTTALTTPNSQKNKSINTYINYNNFEFDSGESFTKIKAKLNIKEDFKTFKEGIEIGNSLKFSIQEDSLNNIVELILHINYVLLNHEDKVKIPVFSKINDDDLIDMLDKKLLDEIKDNTFNINFSEIDIVGANEVFNHNDNTFRIFFKTHNKQIDELTKDELHKFATENNFDLKENILNIKVVSYNNGNPVRTDTIKSLIDYVVDEERCILSKGEWYKYNDDYLNYLADSIKEIESIYEPEYDYKNTEHQEFLNKKFELEKNEEEFEGLSEDQIKEKLKKRYYTEKYYNTNLQEKYQFVNCDRELTKVGSAKVEEMDLYKDGTMYAVKIGNSSGKLSYVIDQSLQTLRIYKHRLSENPMEINNAGIWLILDRRTKLPLDGNKPDLNKIDMIILKNKLDYWKKEVRLMGFKPIIRINYVV